MQVMVERETLTGTLFALDLQYSFKTISVLIACFIHVAGPRNDLPVESRQHILFDHGLIAGYRVLFCQK